MRTIILLFVLVLPGGFVNALKKKLITPGAGVGEITLGMKYKKARKLLGEPFTTHTLEEERSAFETAGYRPDDFLVFRNGFDQVLSYSSYVANFPIFKLYLKKGRVCYIILSKVANASVHSSNFVTKEGLGFNSMKEDVIKVLGDGYRFVMMEGYYGELVYEKAGISFVIDKDNSIGSIDIFPDRL